MLDSRFLACALLIALPLSAAATRIYKSTASDGTTVYSDQPTPQAVEIKIAPSRPATVPASQPSSTTSTPPAGAAKPTTSYTKLRITQPADDSVHWFAQGPVVVNVDVAPPLAEGHVLVPILNGEPQGEGVTATGFSLTDLDPDTYTLSVEVRDAMGKTLKQSAPIRFHFKRQSVNLPSRRPPPSSR